MYTFRLLLMLLVFFLLIFALVGFFYASAIYARFSPIFTQLMFSFVPACVCVSVNINAGDLFTLFSFPFIDCFLLTKSTWIYVFSIIRRCYHMLTISVAFKCLYRNSPLKPPQPHNKHIQRFNYHYVFCVSQLRSLDLLITILDYFALFLCQKLFIIYWRK